MTRPELETLVKDSHASAREWFHHAVKIIDGKFGDGYAEQHPDLISTLVNAMAVDYQVTTRSLDAKEDLDFRENLMRRPSPADDAAGLLKHAGR